MSEATSEVQAAEASADVKKPRLMVRGENLTDNAWWYCGGPNPGDALAGLQNLLAGEVQAMIEEPDYTD